MSTYSQQLYLKYQGGTARDARLGEFPIAHLGRNVYLPFVTDVHLLHGDNPTLDEVAEPEGRGHTTTAGVKLLSIDGPASVVCRDDAACGWLGTRRVTLSQNLVIDARQSSLPVPDSHRLSNMMPAQ